MKHTTSALHTLSALVLSACFAGTGAGRRPRQGRGATARHLGNLGGRYGRAGENLRQARHQDRVALHSGRWRDDAGADLRQRRRRARDRRGRHVRGLREGRADPADRQLDHRRPRGLLVRQGRLADQIAQGRRRQDHGVLGDRLVIPPCHPQAHQDGGRRHQAGPDRRPARELHPDHDRPGRHRLVGCAVRARRAAGEAASGRSRTSTTSPNTAT